jgi:hypothetical protein
MAPHKCAQIENEKLEKTFGRPREHNRLPMFPIPKQNTEMRWICSAAVSALESRVSRLAYIQTKDITPAGSMFR